MLIKSEDYLIFGIFANNGISAKAVSTISALYPIIRSPVQKSLQNLEAEIDLPTAPILSNDRPTEYLDSIPYLPGKDGVCGQRCCVH